MSVAIDPERTFAGPCGGLNVTAHRLATVPLDSYREAICFTESTRTGMDTQTLAVFLIFVASMYLVGQLDREGGRKSLPWVSAACAIGPLAIVLLYIADGVSALSKRLRS